MIYEGSVQPIVTNNLKDAQRISASGALNLGTNMETGDYILQVIVTDKMADKKRQTASQFVPFEIVR